MKISLTYLYNFINNSKLENRLQVVHKYARPGHNIYSYIIACCRLLYISSQIPCMNVKNSGHQYVLLTIAIVVPLQLGIIMNAHD